MTSITEPRYNGIEFDYDPTLCDLCGSDSYTTILDIPHRALTSDTRIVDSGLRKIQCDNCKLARNGYPFSYEELRTHYQNEYQLGEQAALSEPLIFTADGIVPRSKMIFSWIMENLEAAGQKLGRSVIEVGCGEGSLLSHFARLEGCEAHGMDVSGQSVSRARERGLDVARGTYRDVAGSYDLIYSFAVIEHVPSPSDFLSHLKSCLAPGGLLITAQPCQDNGSNDIFFSDHLYHFFSQHVAEFGRRAGLSEIRRAKNHLHIEDFSLHIFQRDDLPARAQAAESVEIDSSVFQRTIDKWTGIFRTLDGWLKQNADKKLAVWGVGQMFKILCAYTELGSRRVIAGFDDNIERFVRNEFDFPVMRFEEADVIDGPGVAVLLTFIPGSNVLERLRAKSVSYFCPLV